MPHFGQDIMALYFEQCLKPLAHFLAMRFERQAAVIASFKTSSSNDFLPVHTPLSMFFWATPLVINARHRICDDKVLGPFARHLELGSIWLAPNLCPDPGFLPDASRYDNLVATPSGMPWVSCGLVSGKQHFP